MEPDAVDFDKPESDVDVLLRELKSLAFSDIGGMYDENNCLKNIADIPEPLRRAIAGIEVDEIYTGTGAARELIGYTRKVKLWDKKGSIDSFMKHLGMFIERIEKTTKVDITVKHVDIEERRLDVKNRLQAVN